MLHGRRALPKDNLPNLESYEKDGVAYVKENYEYVKRRMKQHQSNRCTNIAFITDIHTSNSDYTYSRANRLDKAVSVIKKLSSEFKIQACVFGGDYIYDKGSPYEHSEAVAMLQKVNTLAKRLVNNTHVMICRGNHDGNTNGTTGYNSNYAIDIDEYCSEIQDGINGGDVNANNKYWGYVDDKKNKMRIIYLSAYDLPFSQLRTLVDDEYKIKSYQNMLNVAYFLQELLNFLIDSLKFNESGWAVVIFAHVHTLVAAAWAPNNGSKMGLIILNIIYAYETKGTYDITYNPPFTRSDGTTTDILNISISSTDPNHPCDFTQNKSNEFFVSILGHRHTDTEDKVDIVAGSYQPAVIRTQPLYVHNYIYNVGTYDTAFDVFVFDRLNNKIWVERYGGGMSREYYYYGALGINTYTKTITITVTDQDNNAIDDALVLIILHGTIDVINPSNYLVVSSINDVPTATSQNVGIYYLVPSTGFTNMYDTITSIKKSGTNAYQKEFVGSTVFGTTATNNNGVCSITRIPHDTFDIKVMANGYEDYTYSVDNINFTNKTIKLTRNE